ncbi:MAG: alpha/beta hydrolase [Spirochaetes bacterium]|nr:alpha/beta hydrolase [Spirochaetota bacterium]
MNHIVTSFLNHKGEKLSYHYWEESSRSYNKIIILLHGLCYHAGAYPFLVPALVFNGYKVYGLDFRGFGRSPGERGNIDAFEKYVDDLESFRRMIKSREGYREIIFLGHSLGAAVALMYPMRYPETEARTILASLLFSSPLIDQAVKEDQSSVEITLEDFATDSGRVEQLVADELIVKQISKNLLQLIDETNKQIVSSTDKLRNGRFLFLNGESDRIADPAAVEKFYDKLECRRKKLVTFPRMLHDIFAERRREQVFNAIELWLGETEFEHKAP